MKGRALRRALETPDAIRVNAPVPLIVDTTELITPDVAREMLRRNKSNRPINWRKVEEYAQVMKTGGWKLQPQGIVIDTNGNIITGQKRLWAVIYADTNVYMRVSRGNSADIAKLLDRGDPQTARDLASRDSERKHSPVEASMARAVLALRGVMKPSKDDLANTMAKSAEAFKKVLAATAGTKKTKTVVMVLAAICVQQPDADIAARFSAKNLDLFAITLDDALRPETSERCWGKSGAFALAMEHARRIVAGGL